MPSSPAEVDYARREAVVNLIAAKLRVDLPSGLEALRKCSARADEALHFDLIGMAWDAGSRSADAATRKAMVRYLVDAVGTKSEHEDQALKFLLDFGEADFDRDARAVLETLPLSGERAAQVARVLGVAQLHSRRSELQTLSEQTPRGGAHALYASSAWAASLALVRMGDEERMKSVITQVNAERDLVLRPTQLFDDLAYTRRQEAFDTLRGYLRSTERLPRVKDRVPGTREAVRAATQFALYAEGCPVAGDNVEEADLHRISVWADAQTRWVLRSRAIDPARARSR